MLSCASQEKAIAACAVIALMIPIVKNVFLGKSGTPTTPGVDGPDTAIVPGGTDNSTDNIGSGDSVLETRSLEFNGCFYEASDIPEVLVRFGLPEKISSDLCGEHAAYLEAVGSSGYVEASAATNIELLQYAKDPCRGVYIIKDGDHYYATIFCNFILFSDDGSIGLSELFKAYNVLSAEDIVSITETD